ncbi:YdcF family protein [Anabaena sphaerica FACHB-251]|uniref:YdcF family protein n=1 Tax=Anabaena sphaerica FACHB-251 TaxID=2692883 RepID=A0A926WDE1_9NOST|nr:YdcF family protein [Anabaena sphaerica]MBD2292362.1 YdcF family protein [Anabaena sphaerica FACHB-251]
MKFLYRKIAKYVVFAAVGLSLFLFSIIPIRIAIASYYAPHPQAILTLGGGTERETFTAEFAQEHSHLDIWVSSGTPQAEALAIFGNVSIPTERIHLDYRAVDTVTNFTTLVHDFQKRHIQHIYLITSDFHIPRAKTIATIVLGSQGITFTPISIPSEQPRESIVRIVRDGGRSLLWIVSGRTGASLNPRFHPPVYASR